MTAERAEKGRIERMKCELNEEMIKVRCPVGRDANYASCETPKPSPI